MRSNSAVVAFAALYCAVALPARAQQPEDTCALLNGKEIRAVQEQVVKEVKGSRPPRAGFAVTQCFYTLEPFEKSISLEVTRKLERAAAADPRQDWNTLFRAQSNAPAKKKQVGKPQRVRGVGDEAYWVGDQVFGVLYVLAGDSYFRLSVGGWTDEGLRQRKTKALARLIAKRLRASGGNGLRAGSP